MTPVYLDHAASTPLDPDVADAMAPWWGRPGNPHSPHRHGTAAHAAVEAARAQVAALIGGEPDEVAFTSGATEADNWAVLGAVTAPGQTRRRVVTVATEHSAVLEPCRHLARLGADLVVLGVDRDGQIDAGSVAAAVEGAALVSIMLVNNETGVVGRVAQLARIARAAGALVHTDAAQAAGKVAIDVGALGVDLLSLSGHKLYGPQGIGALWRRRGVALAPLLHGGGQEAGRSGTLPVALAVGLGTAARIARERLATEAAHAAVLRARLRDRLPAHLVNGEGWPGILSATFEVADGARLLADIAGEVSATSGAACASAAGRDSHVLAAMGRTRAQTKATLRLSFGRGTSVADIDRAAVAIYAAVERQARRAA